MLIIFRNDKANHKEKKDNRNTLSYKIAINFVRQFNLYYFRVNSMLFYDSVEVLNCIF